MTGKHLDGRNEPIIDAGLPIIDTHHHLFIRPGLRYMLPDYLDDVGAGHDIKASVYVETRFMSRPDGPTSLRPLGEIEFANGIGAMGASGVFGPCKVAAAIVGHADLTCPSHLADYLDQALARAPERLKGIRQITMSHPDPQVFRHLAAPPPQGLLEHPNFLDGLRMLAPRALTFDAAILHHQLPDLARVADLCPDTTIILNHMGLALCREPGEVARRAVFDDWRGLLREIAKRPNVMCKIGGLGSSYWGFGLDKRPGPCRSDDLAKLWHPWVQTAVEAFGVDRCMMESNYPPDGASCGFVPLWNALKLCVSGASEADKRMLFHDTAKRIYRLPV